MARFTGIQSFREAPRAENLIINGDGVIAQRGTTITAATAFPNGNDDYCLDRWTLISGDSGGSDDDCVDVSTDTTDMPPGGRSAIKMLITATTNKKFGIVQIIEKTSVVVYGVKAEAKAAHAAEENRKDIESGARKAD